MRRDVTAALRLTLQGHLSLRKSRLESFCVLVVGVLLSRTVNLGRLACLFPTRAEIASNYRRLQRFFEQVILDTSQLARVIVRIAGLGSGPWLLALDRTCWTFGRHDINILMLAIIRNGIAIPVMWDVLGRAGTSTTAQRSALPSRFCAVFGECRGRRKIRPPGRHGSGISNADPGMIRSAARLSHLLMFGSPGPQPTAASVA